LRVKLRKRLDNYWKFLQFSNLGRVLALPVPVPQAHHPSASQMHKTAASNQARVRQLFAFSAALLLLAGCRDKVTDPPEAGYRLSARSGTGATGPATGTLHAVPFFQVEDENGAPVEGVRLSLSSSANVQVPDGVAVTGMDGIARVSVVLGDQVGEATVTATVLRNPRLVAEVTLDITQRPTIAGIEPASFASGDTITVSGEAWPALPAVVTIGGVRAREVSGDPSFRKVVVPACASSTAGQVQVQVALGDVVTTPEVAAPLTNPGAALALKQLEGVTVPASLVGQCLALGAADAEYVIVPQYADPGELHSGIVMQPSELGFSLVTGAGAGPVTQRSRPSLSRVAARPNTRAVFEGRRRADEASLAGLAAAAGPRPLAPGAAPSLQTSAPESKQFYILETLDMPERFSRVTASLRYGGERVLLYEDNAAPPNGFNDTDYQRLGQLFDTRLYETAAHMFGAPSDVDQNGRVIVLLSPKVNGLAPFPDCQVTGNVHGYFWGRDLILPALPNSNAAEIFYAAVPDPDRVAGGCRQSTDDVRESVPATFVHELQHMISYNQHVMARGGRQEADWLNEGLSHIAEELVSRAYEMDPGQPRQTPEQLFPDSSQAYIVPNVLNALDYLEAPFASSVTVFRDLGTLNERGAAWLFLRWLGDQKGDEIYRRLVETRSTGWENVEAQANEPFQQMFGDFSLALYADFRPDVDRAGLDSRYRFLTRDFREIFQRFHDLGEISNPFPILAVPISHNETANGSMVQGTMDFYRLTGGSGNTNVSFTAQGGGALPAARYPQVGILRIR